MLFQKVMHEQEPGMNLINNEDNVQWGMEPLSFQVIKLIYIVNNDVEN